MTFHLDQAREALSRTPSVLRALTGGLPPDWLAATPADAEWSAHQVACHLAYVEETDWMVRAHMIREVGPSEPFPPVDHGDQTGWSSALACCASATWPTWTAWISASPS